MKNILIAFMALLTLVSPATADEMQDWTGVWDTQWRGGGAVVELHQDGKDVVGTYPGFEGVIEGRIDGTQLTGTWMDAAGEGVFTFVMSPDQQTFMGRFGTGEWWTGARTQIDMASAFFGELDMSSPERTLESFVRAGNKAGEGRSDRLGIVLPLLDFSANGEELTPYQRIDLTRLFFQIVDRLTFRIWELRPIGDITGETDYTVELTQAGSNLSYPVTFRAVDAGDERSEPAWRLVIPPEGEMRESLEELTAIHGGVVPHSRAHRELGSPRATMRTFIEYWDQAEKKNTELFLETMDLSRIPAAIRNEEGALLGEYLIEVLYRIGRPLRQEIPDNPERRGRYVHFLHPSGVVEIVPSEREDGSVQWQFSADTMDSARQLFMALEDMPLLGDKERAHQPTTFFQLRNQVRGLHRDLLQETRAGVELWQWLALTLWLLMALPLGWVLTWGAAKVLRLQTHEDEHSLSAAVRFIWPLRLVFVAAIGLFAVQSLGLPQSVDIPLRVFFSVILSIIGGWLGYNFVDKINEFLELRATQDQILRSLATSIAKLAVIIGAILFLAEVLSIPYQGVIAGLGIGGLAVALAARSTLENLIGGLTLFADKPVEAGDFCQVGEHLGVIEGIGLRSVKLRSLDRTIITIPNAEFINLNIENLTRRDRILLRKTIGLRYETTPDQLRWVLTEIRILLLKHPMITPEPSRARFLGFGEHSVDIEIFAYVKTNDWNEFLAVQEDVFLRLIDIVEESGTGVAFPSVVNYLARDGGIDEESTERAEQIVRELRDGDALPFPNLGVKARKELRDQLDYPPKGSVDLESRGEKKG